MSFPKTVDKNVLALEVQDRLNAISISLFASKEITDAIVFTVTDDYVEYVNTKPDTTNIISCMLNFFTGVNSPSKDYNQYTENAVFNLEAEFKQRESIELILEQYVVADSNVPTQNGVWHTEKIITRPLISSPQITNGVDLISATFSLSYQFTEGAVTKNQVVVQINGEAMPILSYSLTANNGSAPRNRPNTTDTVNTNLVNTNSISMSIQYIKNNSQCVKIAKDLHKRNNINRKYRISYEDDAFSASDNYVISSGVFSMEDFNIISMEIVWVLKDVTVVS
jgi:hypothetical protein